MVSPDRVRGWSARHARSTRRADDAFRTDVRDGTPTRLRARTVVVLAAIAARVSRCVSHCPHGGGGRRASMVIITRKAASPATASAVADTIRHRFPGTAVGVVALALQELRSATGESTMPLEALIGARALAIIAIGDPPAFLRQLTATEATCASGLPTPTRTRMRRSRACRDDDAGEIASVRSRTPSTRTALA